jgi:two-component system NtrC family response regulator
VGGSGGPAGPGGAGGWAGFGNLAGLGAPGNARSPAGCLPGIACPAPAAGAPGQTAPGGTAPASQPPCGAAQLCGAAPPAWKDYRNAALGSVEKGYLHHLLLASGGNITRAARMAGLSRQRLYALLRKHGVMRQWAGDGSSTPE